MRRALIIIVLLTVAFVACGRQITPSTALSGSTISPGQMLIRFRTVGQMNFASYKYIIVFNTSGNGQEPYANALQTGFLNYSYAWVIGGTSGSLPNPPTLVQYFLEPGTSAGLGTQTIVVPNTAANLITNTDGNNTTFQLVFTRQLFSQPNPTQSTPPSPVPTTAAQESWNINFFTTNLSGVPIDAGGVNGVNDVAFNLPVNTTQQVDLVDPFQKTGASTTVPDPASQIAGGEIINQP